MMTQPTETDQSLHSSTIVLTVVNEPKITYPGKVIKDLTSLTWSYGQKTHTMQNLLDIIIINIKQQHTNGLNRQGDQGTFHEAVSLAVHTLLLLLQF
jgi:hypothetical protein